VRSVLVLCLALLLGAPLAAARPLNLLFILTDNQPASILGAYGNPDVRTPNIDRLAREGMLFRNAFAANSMCSPTRATLMTGLMPSQHGVHNWLDDSLMDEWPRDWSAIAEYRTLPLTLANRGYQTAMIGKWHLGQPWEPSVGFQHWVTFTDGHTVDFWNNTVIENDKVYKVENRHTVDFFAEKAVQYLESHDPGQPLYLQLNLNGPYLNPPSNYGPARNRHYESYLDSEFASFPRVPFNANVAHQLIEPETPDFLVKKHLEAIAMHNDRETMANVASQNTVVDDAVGRVLAALESSGLADNTLVIFSSDQGNFYGQHGLWQHAVVTSPASLYEAAMNIPLIMRHPGSVRPGSQSTRLIGQYDLPVTILDYLGVDVPLEKSPGRSFSGLLSGDDASWTDEVFYEQEESRGIRTPRYAYWKRIEGTGNAELYDMEKDPGQHRNLIDEPALQATVASLDKRLDSFFLRYSDPVYDLWRGGIAKGSVIRPGLFQKLYGPEWRTRTDLKEPFRE
jgi:arylsulfatase A-like enzyme